MDLQAQLEDIISSLPAHTNARGHTYLDAHTGGIIPESGRVEYLHFAYERLLTFDDSGWAHEKPMHSFYLDGPLENKDRFLETLSSYVGLRSMEEGDTPLICRRGSLENGVDLRIIYSNVMEPTYLFSLSSSGRGSAPWNHFKEVLPAIDAYLQAS